MSNNEDQSDSGIERDDDEVGCRSAVFMDLVTPNQNRLFGYIFALVQNGEDAHDLYQQTVLALWKKFDTFVPGTNFTAWAMRTAQLECLAFRRARSRSRLQFSETLIAQLSETLADVGSDAVVEARHQALLNCMTQLDAKDHTLVKDCYRHGVKIQDVAEQLGRTSQSVCNSLRRIRLALLKCIDLRMAQGGEA